MKKKLLVVDDEWNMLNLIKIHLSKNYDIVQASDGYEALEHIKRQTFDLIILDVMMPDINGWELCKKIRETLNTPILMLTARSELKDKVHGIELGADDYLIKPFAFEELAVRIFALLRRSESYQKTNEQEEIVEASGLIIQKESRQVLINNHQIELTPKEFDLIWLLASQPQRVFTREILLDRVWGVDENRDLRTVDTHIKNIRVKIREANGPYKLIKTVWGVGYKFDRVDG